MFTKTNPGAVQHGNFINYYHFNPVQERIGKLIKIPDNIWKFRENPYLVLDVGCNSGQLTKELYKFLKEKGKCDVVILGIDIDNNLIKKTRSVVNTENSNLVFECINVMNENEFEFVNEFMKKHERLKFDAVFCLSITMWIHLNNGDKGLKDFLRKTAAISNLFIIEPQPWKCYKSALRRRKRADLSIFPNYDKLQWRGTVEVEINNYLENDLKKIKSYVTEPTIWSRQLFLYT